MLKVNALKVLHWLEGSNTVPKQDKNRCPLNFNDCAIVWLDAMVTCSNLWISSGSVPGTASRAFTSGDTICSSSIRSSMELVSAFFLVPDGWGLLQGEESRDLLLPLWLSVSLVVRPPCQARFTLYLSAVKGKIQMFQVSRKGNKCFYHWQYYLCLSTIKRIRQFAKSFIGIFIWDNFLSTSN